MVSATIASVTELFGKLRVEVTQRLPMLDELARSNPVTVPPESGK